MKTAVTTAELSAGYFKLKAKLAAMHAEHEAAEKALKENISLLEEALIERLHAEKLTSIKTDEGVFGVTETTVYSADDMEAVRSFAAKTGEFGIFNMSLSVTGMREYAERNKGSLPPGVTEVKFDRPYNRPARNRASS